MQEPKYFHDTINYRFLMKIEEKEKNIYIKFRITVQGPNFFSLKISIFILKMKKYPDFLWVKSCPLGQNFSFVNCLLIGQLMGAWPMGVSLLEL